MREPSRDWRAPASREGRRGLSRDLQAPAAHNGMRHFEARCSISEQSLGPCHLLQNAVGLGWRQNLPALGTNPERVVAEEDALHGERTNLFQQDTPALGA